MSGAPSSLLSARGLSIGWIERTERVLASGIELELAPGEIAVLVGPNGAGKSTLLRTLLGRQPPLAGEARLCGRNVARLSVEERSRLVASVFTDRYDSGYFSVFDIVAFGRYPYTDARGRLSEADREAVLEAIAAVGLGGFEERLFAELSDGERQKALVARAVAQDCPLLVLDEPTAFLDASARVEVFHLARSLARDKGKALVLSTHDLDHALRNADRLWLMDGKHRFRSGAPEDLAMGGQVGAAFDGALFRFDLESGAFKSLPAPSPMAVELRGDQGPALAWAGRLVERLGLVVAARGGGARIVASIEVEESPGGPLFELRPADDAGGAGLGASRGAVEAASYEELANALRDIVSREAG